MWTQNASRCLTSFSSSGYFRSTQLCCTLRLGIQLPQPFRFAFPAFGTSSLALGFAFSLPFVPANSVLEHLMGFSQTSHGCQHHLAEGATNRLERPPKEPSPVFHRAMCRAPPRAGWDTSARLVTELLNERRNECRSGTFKVASIQSS